MAGLVTRPSAPLAYRAGPMLKDHFQVAYVTSDLDRATQLLGTRYGIARYSFIDGEMAGGGTIRVAFAWVGSTMFEIIDCKGPQADFYTARLPQGEFAIRLHHLGYLLHDRASWDAVEREIAASGWPVAFRTQNPGYIDAIYIDAPELGHYLEYIYPMEAGVQFFESIPVN
jgi:Glyoxalase/Bleomycin resistance protein/Dioxygenase superfamily